MMNQHVVCDSIEGDKDLKVQWEMYLGYLRAVLLY